MYKLLLALMLITSLYTQQVDAQAITPVEQAYSRHDGRHNDRHRNRHHRDNDRHRRHDRDRSNDSNDSGDSREDKILRIILGLAALKP